MVPSQPIPAPLLSNASEAERAVDLADHLADLIIYILIVYIITY